MNTDKSLYQVKYYSNITPKEIDWLWYPYIPYGKITIIQGDPGEGKSTVAISLTSMISNGSNLPLSNKKICQGTVVYQNNEDGKEDTIVPRLISNNANLKNVAYIEAKNCNIELGNSNLEKVIEETSAKLVILDPIQSYLNEKTDMNRAGDVRPIMNKLAKIAQKKNCAIVLIGHLSKNNSSKGLYRGLGSIDIGASARSILLVSSINENDKIITHLKSNLAPKGESIIFNIINKSTIKWIRHSSLTAEQVINGDYNDEDSKFIKATQIIEDCLSNNIFEAQKIKEKCFKSNISERTINRAKEKLNIKSTKKAKSWLWKRKN